MKTLQWLAILALLAAAALLAQPSYAGDKLTEAQKWEVLRVAFIACRDTKGATAQHACAARYADLALDLYGESVVGLHHRSITGVKHK